MDKEHIEQAAKQAIHECYNCNGKFPCVYKDECMYHNGHNTSYDCDECCADDFYEGFIKCAEWRINSVWHDTKDEMPEYNKHVVNEDWFDFEAKDEKDLKRILKDYPFKRWAYVEDLLPERKENAE